VASSWLAGLKAVAQPVAGALPALMLVIFAGLLALLGLICEEGRRSYALAYADRFVDLASVLVGRQGKHRSPTWSDAAHPTIYRTIDRDRRTRNTVQDHDR
jgi:hypothetical protein